MDFFSQNNEAQTDYLTGAFTKDSLVSQVSKFINTKSPFTYAKVDIDNFTYIKDTFGQNIANKVLCYVSKEIIELINTRGILARGEGDEFFLLLKDIVEYDEVWSLCHTILVKLNELQIPEIGNQTITVTMGVVRYPENADSQEEIFECAEKALYRGKTKGRNCFIIYLPEKHANVIPNDEKQRALGSMSLHSNVFRFLTATDDLRMGIISLFNFISSCFEIDHLCIQTASSFYIQRVHPQVKNKDFKYIPNELIQSSINNLTEVLYISDTKNLLRAGHKELYELFKEQEITSTCFCEISYRNEVYGMIRADMTESENENRLWKYSEMDLLLTAAKTIALILHYTGKTFESL